MCFASSSFHIERRGKEFCVVRSAKWIESVINCRRRKRGVKLSILERDLWRDLFRESRPEIKHLFFFFSYSSYSVSVLCCFSRGLTLRVPLGSPVWRSDRFALLTMTFDQYNAHPQQQQTDGQAKTFILLVSPRRSLLHQRHLLRSGTFCIQRVHFKARPGPARQHQAGWTTKLDFYSDEDSFVVVVVGCNPRARPWPASL